MLFFGRLRVRSNTENTKSLTSCFSAWAKKADVDTEGALLAALDTKEEIPIIPYSSLFILSSENKYDSNNDGNKSNDNNSNNAINVINDNNDDPNNPLLLFLLPLL